jgi:hypothetical protein
MSLKLLCIAAVMSLLLVSPVLAEVWGPLASDNYADQTVLQITRAVTGASEWQWTFSLHHGSASATAIHQFSAGLLVDDTGGLGFGSLSSGHYYGYTSSIAGATAIETTGNAIWLGFLLSYGQTATFSFKTDLPEVGLASHIARDNTYTPTWASAQTPATPEPAGFAALMIGLVGLVGRLKKK